MATISKQWKEYPWKDRYNAKVIANLKETTQQKAWNKLSSSDRASYKAAEAADKIRYDKERLLFVKISKRDNNGSNGGGGGGGGNGKVPATNPNSIHPAAAKATKVSQVNQATNQPNKNNGKSNNQTKNEQKKKNDG